MPKYVLEVDETYRINGTRSFYEFTDESLAIAAYHESNRGMVNLRVTTTSEDGKETTRLLQDTELRKYVKGSPFYKFPHVPHISKIDGAEIPST